MKLTVFGATGRTGREVVRQALDAGHEVTAVVRDPARLPVPAGDRLDVVTVPGVTDAEALRQFVEGRDAVLSGIGATGRKPDGIAESSTRTIVRALEVTGTRRLITISAAPVGPLAEDEPFLGRRILLPLIRAILKDVYADLAGSEAELRRSALDWTAVRPGNLANRPFTGRYRRAIGANVPGAGTLGRADLAAAMLDCLGDPATVKQFVGLGAAKG
jgi:putative NADH-flavin reductase